MTEITEFVIGTTVSCTDGDCGKVTRVVVDPVARTVTHLVIQGKHHLAAPRLVALDLVDATTDLVRLACTLEAFEHLEAAEETHFLGGASGYGTYGPDQVLSWPYYGLTAGVAGLDMGTYPPVLTTETLPLGEVTIRRGEHVHATDGEIGRVQGLVIERDRHHVTHVLLQEGHVWGRKDVAIPIVAVDSVDDGVRLTITKLQVQNLPPVDFDDPGSWADLNPTTSP